MFLATTILFSLAGDVQAAEFQAQEAQVQTYAESLRTGKRYALVIGISDYQDGNIKDLGTAAHDAEEVGAMLEGYYGFEVTPLIEEQATRRRILRELSKLASVVKNEDSVIIYFAGHGQRDDQRAFWMPYDAEAGGDADLGAEDTWIPHNELLAKLKKFEATKHILVLSDSCWAGGLFRGDLRGAAGPSTPPANRQFEPWIQKVSEKKSRVIFTSGGDEPVADSTAGVSKSHSIFAHYFLQALQEEFAETPFTTNMLVGFMKPVIGNLEDQQPQSAPIRHLPHEGGEMVFVSKEVRRKATEPNTKKANFSSAIDNSYEAQTQVQNMQFRQWLGVKNEKVKILVRGKEATALKSQYLATLDAWTERLKKPASTEVPPELAEIAAEIAIAFTFEGGSVENEAESKALLEKNTALISDYRNQTTHIRNRLMAFTPDFASQEDHINLLMAQNAIRFVDATYFMPISFSHVEDDDSKMRMEEMVRQNIENMAIPWDDRADILLSELLAQPQWSPIHYQACALLQKIRPRKLLPGQCDNPGQQVAAIPLITALANLRKSGAAPSAQDLPFLLALANNAVQAHWSEGMIGLLEMAVSFAPDDPVVLNLLGLAHFYSESPDGKENARKILAHVATKHPYRPEIQKSLFWLAEDAAQEVAALTQLIALQGQELAAGWACHTDACETTLKRLKNVQRAVRAEERRSQREIARLQNLDGVTSVIKHYKGRIKLCYNQALRQDPQLSGRVEIEFSVGHGRVLEAFISTNSTRNDDLANCILRKVKALTFDPSVEADVIYPFVLTQ